MIVKEIFDDAHRRGKVILINEYGEVVADDVSFLPFGKYIFYKRYDSDFKFIEEFETAAGNRFVHWCFHSFDQHYLTLIEKVY